MISLPPSLFTSTFLSFPSKHRFLHSNWQPVPAPHSLAGVTALTEEEEGLLKEAADLTGAFPGAEECFGVPFVEDRLFPRLNF